MLFSTTMVYVTKTRTRVYLCYTAVDKQSVKLIRPFFLFFDYSHSHMTNQPTFLEAFEKVVVVFAFH